MKGARRRRHVFGLESAFAGAVRDVPPGRRPELRAWLRAWRRRLRPGGEEEPERVFWVLDVVEGRWRRV